MSRARMFAIRFGVALVLATAAAVAPVTQASAAGLIDCSGDTPHQDNSGQTNRVGFGVPIRSGPSSGCTVRSYDDTWVDLHCWTVNSAGHVWWFVRAYNDTKGWVYEPNFFYSASRIAQEKCS